MYPNQLYGSSLNKMYTLKYWETSYTNTDAPVMKMIQPFNSLDFKNRYVNANINIKSSKIIVNIYTEINLLGEIIRFGIPNSQFCRHKLFCSQIEKTRFQCFFVSVKYEID